MRNLVIAASAACLAANLVPSILFLQGRIELAAVHQAMIWTTIAWYVVAGVLIYGNQPPSADELDADREPFVP
jgi:hypothetical protein